MKEKIVEVLKGERLTVENIADKINKKYNLDIEDKILINRIRVYINRLKKDNVIEKCGIVNRYKVYELKDDISNDKPLNLLKELYEFMSNEEKCELKDINESDINFLTKIKEMIS